MMSNGLQKPPTFDSQMAKMHHFWSCRFFVGEFLPILRAKSATFSIFAKVRGKDPKRYCRSGRLDCFTLKKFIIIRIRIRIRIIIIIIVIVIVIIIIIIIIISSSSSSSSSCCSSWHQLFPCRWRSHFLQPSGM